MYTLLINNCSPCHYEIIETIISKYYSIFPIPKECDIFLNICGGNDFRKYISNKYSKIRFSKPKKYDYFIECTINNENYKYISKNSDNKFYISHRVIDELKNLSNVVCLTPLAKRYIKADVLPFKDSKKCNTKLPIYIVQGNITKDRRNYDLIVKILENNYKYDFRFKFIGRGNLPNKIKKYHNKVILKNKLNFINYHKEFLDGYCILPSITKKSHPNYYKTTLTSTMNYASAYKLKCLIDKDLQNIYKLEDVEIFDDINNIVDAFRKTLVDYYMGIGDKNNLKSSQ